MYYPKAASVKLKDICEAGSVEVKTEIVNPKEVEVEVKVLIQARTKLIVLYVFGSGFVNV